jgi:hypothetical protein
LVLSTPPVSPFSKLYLCTVRKSSRKRRGREERERKRENTVYSCTVPPAGAYRVLLDSDDDLFFDFSHFTKKKQKTLSTSNTLVTFCRTTY